VFVLFRCGDDLVVCDRVFIYTLVVSLVVCNARSRLCCFVAECVDEQTGASCRALSNVNCLFSSLFLSPFLFFPPPCL
jgi:hypothetical protein